MRKALVLIGLVTSLVIGLAVPTSSVYAQPAAEAELTAEQASQLIQLEAALLAADTPEEKAKVLQDAITANPGLASDPATSARVLSAAQQNGLSAAQIDTAVIYGLALAYAAVRTPAPATSSVADAESLVDTIVDLIASGDLSEEEGEQLVERSLELIADTGEDANEVAQNLVEELQEEGVDNDTVGSIVDTINDSDDVTVVIVSKSGTTSTASLF